MPLASEADIPQLCTKHAEMQPQLHTRKCIKPLPYVVDHDSRALREALQLANRRRLDDIEGSKKYKAREKGFPGYRDSYQSDQLTCYFVDDHELRIVKASFACDSSSCRDSNSDG